MIINARGFVRLERTLRPPGADAFGGFVRLERTATSKNKLYDLEMMIGIGSAMRTRHVRAPFMIVSAVRSAPGCGS